MKAYCETCQEFTVPVKKRLTEGWGIGTWLLNITMILLTGGFWIALLAGWKLMDILHPPMVCNKCRSDILDTQLVAD